MVGYLCMSYSNIWYLVFLLLYCHYIRGIVFVLFIVMSSLKSFLWSYEAHELSCDLPLWLTHHKDLLQCFVCVRGMVTVILYMIYVLMMATQITRT